MSTENGARGVLVDTGLVGEEVSVDGEGSFNWTVLEQFGLDLLLRADGVDALAEVLVLGVRGGVTIDALLGAFRRRLLISALNSIELVNADELRSTHGWLSAVDARRNRTLLQRWTAEKGNLLVVARGDGVRLAAFLAVVVATGDEASALVVRPGRLREATIASEAARRAARCKESIDRSMMLTAREGTYQRGPQRRCERFGLRSRQCRYGRTWLRQRRKPSSYRSYKHDPTKCERARTTGEVTALTFLDRGLP